MTCTFACVYKYQTASGKIIYVGKATRGARELKKRCDAHARDADFIPYLNDETDPVSIFYSMRFTAPEAEALETLLIQHYCPAINKEHVLTRQEAMDFMPESVINLDGIVWKPYSAYLEYLVENKGVRGRKDGSRNGDTKTYLINGDHPVKYLTIRLDADTERAVREVQGFLGGTSAFFEYAARLALSSDELKEFVEHARKMRAV